MFLLSFLALDGSMSLKRKKYTTIVEMVTIFMCLMKDESWLFDPFFSSTNNSIPLQAMILSNKAIQTPHVQLYRATVLCLVFSILRYKI